MNESRFAAVADGEVVRSQTDVVVFEIKKLLIDGVIKPGDRLPIEKDLAQELGVSRSSLREGVRALSIMGVLETRQGAGTYVTSLDPSLLLAPMAFVVDLQHSNDAVYLHSVRRVLETEAAGLAAVHMPAESIAEARDVLERMSAAIAAAPVDHEAILQSDIDFHQLISSNTGNPVLAALISALSTQTIRARLWRAISVTEAQEVTLAEHRLILKAIADHSVERARLRMATHLMEVEEFLSEGPVEPPGTA